MYFQRRRVGSKLADQYWYMGTNLSMELTHFRGQWMRNEHKLENSDVSKMADTC